MAGKTHFTVVRNQGYGSSEFKTRERHNERENENYFNADIVPERADKNVIFRRYVFPDGKQETYEHSFQRMVATGAVVKRGLKPDAKVFGELVFDVNSEYFEQHGDGSPAGSYDYAKSFYAEAYKMAAKEVGEEYILSAVMHADERNTALSEQLGHDVYHYHLHVVYIPVVEKKIYFRKDNKDPGKAGKLREVIPQISHSKKWPIKVPVERDGKHFFVNSYSLLQDRYFEHMRAAGFRDFERGERGSTAEHLEVLDYKIQQDKARAAALAATVKQRRNDATVLAGQADQQQKRLDSLEKKTAVAKKDADAFLEIDAIGKPALLGGYNVTALELKKLKRLAKEGQQSRAIIKDLRGKNDAQTAEITGMQAKLKQYGDGLGITDTMHYYQAKQRAPRRMAETIADVMCQSPERTGPERTMLQRKRSTGLEIGG